MYQEISDKLPLVRIKESNGLAHTDEDGERDTELRGSVRSFRAICSAGFFEKARINKSSLILPSYLCLCPLNQSIKKQKYYKSKPLSSYGCYCS